MKNNIFVINNERCKMKEKEMRGIMGEYREVKSLNLNEAMICLSTEKEAQLTITEINTYVGWRAELHKPTEKSREFERATKKPDNSNNEKEHGNNNESSTN